MEISNVVILEVTTPQDHYALVKQHDDCFLDGDPNTALDQKTINLFVSHVVDLPTEITHSENQPHPFKQI